MIAVFVNAVAVLIGSLIGTRFGNSLDKRYSDGIMVAIGLITAAIGIQSVMASGNTLVMVLSLVAGTAVGIALKLDKRIDSLGDVLKGKLEGTRLSGSRLGDAFVSSSVLFCVGTMTIIGSIKAGVSHDYSIIFTKSIMDFCSSMVFAAALGVGVVFSTISVIVVQGMLTLLGSLLEPVLTQAVISEMSAVGGAIFLGLAINLLELRKERVRVGDMIPAVFLPILFLPLMNWLGLG